MSDETKTAVAHKQEKVIMRVEQVRFENIYADHDRNVRMASNMSVTPIPNFDPQRHRAGLYESVSTEGLKQPLTVAKLSPEEIEKIRDKALAAGVPNPKYRVIAGHRRHKVITAIRATTPDRLVEVPCIVHIGLSETDEIKLMMDHEHVQNLNEFEKYLAIKRLLMTGLSEEAVGIKMAVSRGYVQRRGWIAKLPPVVEENFRLKFEPPADPKNPHQFVAFTDKDLQKLSEASNLDRSKGTDPLVDVSETMRVWNTIVETGRAAAPEPKGLTRKEILAKMSYVHDPLMKAVMQLCAGDPTIQLPELVAEMESLRKKAEPKS